MSSHFFGDLYLPDPQIFLNREQLQALRSIQMSLDQFSQPLQSTALTTRSTNARPPTPISSDTSTPYEATYDKEMTDDENRQAQKRPKDPDLEIWTPEAAFLRFASQEMATWSPARPSHELVRLAGAKSARAVQHLNCPSYTSSQKDREGATIADPSNSCLKLVSFLFDDFNRREHRHGLGKYSTRRSRLHLDLSNEYRQNINAKVEIVWGKRQKSSSSTNLETVYKLCPYGVPTFMMSPSMLSISMQMMYAQSADRVRTLLSVCSGSSYLCIIRSTSMMIGECPSR